MCFERKHRYFPSLLFVVVGKIKEFPGAFFPLARVAVFLLAGGTVHGFQGMFFVFSTT